MKLVLTHSDRRIGPDRHEFEALRDLVGSAGRYVLQSECCRISSNKIQCAFVDIDCPDSCSRRLQCHRQRNRPPATAQVEKISPGWSRGHVCEQHGGAGVDSIGAEYSARRHKLVRAAE